MGDCRTPEGCNEILETKYARLQSGYPGGCDIPDEIRELSLEGTAIAVRWVYRGDGLGVQTSIG